MLDLQCEVCQTTTNLRIFSTGRVRCRKCLKSLERVRCKAKRVRGRNAGMRCSGYTYIDEETPLCSAHERVGAEAYEWEVCEVCKHQKPVNEECPMGLIRASLGLSHNLKI